MTVVYKQSVHPFELPYVATGKQSAISLTRRSHVLLSSATRIFTAKYKYRQISLCSSLQAFLLHISVDTPNVKPWDNRGMLAIFVILSVLIISP